ncbi:Lipoprotein signal peptidase [Novipirellula galeiformis]|uniref:Lipoprotein signal peptidase n=1 Tax=Novipirellula galeiformis TaxID=2528004 RepID=A0A5C6CS50_9BACT|nr:signal peptidase II [Novipirellula galeiformis]TWU26384.1 Lipoprotein signal peptidase [Novipirellula galeiformis]
MDETDRALSTSSPMSVPKNRVWVFLGLALTGAIADLWSKQAIFAWRGLPGQKDIWWVVEGYFGIETAVNLGAVFGIGQGQGLIFAGLSIVAGVGILAWLFWFRAAYSMWLTVALGLIGGGIIGNLYDRLGMWWQPGYPEAWKSGVRDWVLWQASNQWRWPNFNIADSLLVVGACMLMYQSFFPEQVGFPIPEAKPDEAGESSSQSE